jgi:general secretion pathway protein I
MRRHHAPAGFTLVEVLVALAIVAIALAAGARASGALVANAERQSAMLLAQLCAENELIRVRLSRQTPPTGDAAFTCPQAGQVLGGTLSVYPTPNPIFRRVEANVRAGIEPSAVPLLTVATIIGPPQ